jgi:hypothetical protein
MPKTTLHARRRRNREEMGHLVEEMDRLGLSAQEFAHPQRACAILASHAAGRGTQGPKNYRTPCDAVNPRPIRPLIGLGRRPSSAPSCSPPGPARALPDPLPCPASSPLLGPADPLRLPPFQTVNRGRAPRRLRELAAFASSCKDTGEDVRGVLSVLQCVDLVTVTGPHGEEVDSGIPPGAPGCRLGPPRPGVSELRRRLAVDPLVPRHACPSPRPALSPRPLSRPCPPMPVASIARAPPGFALSSPLRILCDSTTRPGLTPRRGVAHPLQARPGGKRSLRRIQWPQTPHSQSAGWQSKTSS